MNVEDVRKKIKQSPNPAFFQEVKIVFNNTPLRFQQPIEGFLAIYQFVNSQVNGWGRITANLPDVLDKNRVRFQQLRNLLVEFILQNANNDNLANIEHRWNVEIFRWMGQWHYWFTYDHPVTSFLKKMHDESPNQVRGAYEYFIGQGSNLNVNDRNYMKGALKAYEFDEEGSSRSSRSKTERKSLNALRTEFTGLLSTAHEDLAKHLNNTEKDYSKHEKKLQGFYDTNQKKYDDWQKEINERFDKLVDDSGKKVTLLEETFAKLLELREPAKHWEERAEALKKQGWRSFIALLLLVCTGVALLYILLWKGPSEIFTAFDTEDKTPAIRWSIIFIVFISFLVLGAKAIMRVMFSSFHLARDAEERVSLTYYYLALIENSSIDPEDRELILQSLFSRSDTGLLKEDSSPTMPNDFLNKISRKVGN